MRVRSSLLNFASSLLFMAVTTILALWTTPLLITLLGTKRCGGFRTVADTYGYLALLELGLGGALGPLLVRALGDRDERALLATAATGARAYLKVALRTLAVGLALTPLVPLFARGLAGPGVADLRRAWVVGLASTLTLVALPLRALADARQLSYLVNLMLTGQAVLITGLSVALAYAGWGMTGQAAAQVAGSWTFGVALAAVGSRTQPGLLRAMLTAPSEPEVRRAIRGLSPPTLLITVSERIGLLTDNLVVGALLRPDKVTSLIFTKKLVSVAQSVLQGVGGATWAALAELDARGEHDAFNRRLVEISRTISILAAVGLVPVVVFKRAFVRLWIKDPAFVYGGDALVALAAVNALLLAQETLWGWCFAATGKVRLAVAPSVATAAINLTASVTLTDRVGLAGPLLGTTIALVSVGLWALPMRLRRAFGTPTPALARAVWVPAAFGAAAALGLRWLTEGREPTGWAALAAEMILTAMAMLVLCSTALLTPEDRSLWYRRLRDLRVG